jgi:poly(hydroxyalkanoate) depolymerase family esterase
MMDKFIAFLFLITFSFSLFADDQLFAHRYTSINGTRPYKVFLPKTFSKNNKIPVIIALHGCTQTSEEFYLSTRINSWAQKYQYAVIYPEQNSFYNPQKCWNWFMPNNQWRNLGELELVMGMLKYSIDKYSLNKNKVYVMGFSAGAAITSALVNCYQDRIQGAAIHSGVMYKASSSVINAVNVLNNGSPHSPTLTAEIGFKCSGGKIRATPLPIIVFQGKEDKLVNQGHLHTITQQFLSLNDYFDNGDLDQSLILKRESKKLFPNKKYSFEQTKWTSKGMPVVTSYLIDELNHSWSGGDSQYEYNDAKGPDATELIFEFFNEIK